MDQDTAKRIVRVFDIPGIVRDAERDLVERMIADIEMGGVMVMIPMLASKRMGVVDTRDWIRSFLEEADTEEQMR